MFHVIFLGGSLMPFCRFRRSLIQRLLAQGARVTCVTWGHDPDGFFHRFDLPGLVWHDRGGDHASPPGPADLAPMARLFRLIRATRPDTICCFNAKPIVLPELGKVTAQGVDRLGALPDQ